jgi:hypothetical protein
VLPNAVFADPAHSAAIAAITELLSRLRTDFAFVGSVARAAWIGGPVSEGPVDVIAAVTAEGRHQIPMMARNRGFRVDDKALDQAQELDLVPLSWAHGSSEVRIHVLIASNALYGTMIRDSVPAVAGATELNVVSRGDFALLMMMNNDPAFEQLTAQPDFDRAGFNQLLASIGLGSKVLS